MSGKNLRRSSQMKESVNACVHILVLKEVENLLTAVELNSCWFTLQSTSRCNII